MSDGRRAAPPSGVLVHRAERDVVRFTGADAGTFLHSQLANDVSDLPVLASVHSLVLEPTGHLCAVARVTRTSQDRWLVDVDAGHGAALVRRLARFVLRADVSIEMTDLGCVAVRGPGARRWADSWSQSSGHDSACTAAPWWGIEAADSCDLVGDRLPVADAPTGELDAARVDAAWPRLGVDLEPGDLPATTGLVSIAVSFSKGCYPGQELVERMDSRAAGPPVALRTVPAATLRPGDDLVVDGATVGTVTSVGRSRAIARVKRGAEVGETLGPIDGAI